MLVKKDDWTLNTEKIQKISIQELLTRVRAEMADEEVNEKLELIRGNTRYALAFLVTDEKRFLFFDRSTLSKLNTRNKNTQLNDLPLLDRIDAPIGSRGFAPDSSFKVPELNEAIIQDIRFLGIAKEDTKKTGAKNDARYVCMPTYLIWVDKKYLDEAGENNPDSIRLLTQKEIERMFSSEAEGEEQYTAKVGLLKEYFSQ